MTKEQAVEFAKAWIAAWNSRDITRIMAHYADTIEHTTPLAQALGVSATGTISGKENLRAYFVKGLEHASDAKFSLVNVFLGVEGIAILYKGAAGRIVVEVLIFDASHAVRRSIAYYSEVPEAF